MKLLFTLLLILLAGQLRAQELLGKVFDERKCPIGGASVKVCIGDVVIEETVTDWAGNFVLRPMVYTGYNIKVSCRGYEAASVLDIRLSCKEPTIVSVDMSRFTDICKIDMHYHLLWCLSCDGRSDGNLYVVDSVIIPEPQPKRFYASVYNPASGTIDNDYMKYLPYTGFNDVIAVAGGHYQKQRGDNLPTLGGR